MEHNESNCELGMGAEHYGFSAHHYLSSL